VSPPDGVFQRQEVGQRRASGGVGRAGHRERTNSSLTRHRLVASLCNDITEESVDDEVDCAVD